MLQQILTYYTSGSTAVLQETGNNIIFSNVSLHISGSEYETDSPGGFDSTIGTIRIELYSGSILVASFPYDQTNLIINSSSDAFVPIIPTNVTFGFPITYDGEFNSSYFFNLIESASSDIITQAFLIEGTNQYATSLYSSSKYIAEVYSGDNKYNLLSLFDGTGSLLLTSSWIVGSGSVVIEPTGSSVFNLNVTVSGSVCCAPTLLSIEELGYDRLKFNYITGSCGTFSSMSVFYSTDQINWSVLVSGSSPTMSISNSGSYPVSTSYYRLVQRCIYTVINSYNSDPSNVISFTPSSIPNISGYYYVSIIGRTNSGTGSKSFYYSPDSGSTQILLGSFYYDTIYKPITSFFVPTGSTLIINPNVESCYYGVGYNGGFSSYNGTNANPAGNYGVVISDNTTIYVNINNTGSCS